MLGDILIDTENYYQNKEIVKTLLNNKKRNLELRYLMMNKDEHGVFNALPERITVYRGTGSNHEDEGISWTTDIEVACKFAKRYRSSKDKGLVFQALCYKKDIIAYFSGRNESEVVTCCVSDKKVIRKFKGKF